MTRKNKEEGLLLEVWKASWPKALAVWSTFTRLAEPRWCFSSVESKKQGLESSFAMIRLTDHAIVIDLGQVAKNGTGALSVEILAHEIGHHVYCPADMNDQGRLIARMRRALRERAKYAGFVANLWSDILINDRLFRVSKLDMPGVYQALEKQNSEEEKQSSEGKKQNSEEKERNSEGKKKNSEGDKRNSQGEKRGLRGENQVSRVWTLYMRIYEILWSLQKGTLTRGETDAEIEGDARLGARVARVYANDWLRGGSRFAVLLQPYIFAETEDSWVWKARGLLDAAQAGAGGEPSGLIEIEDDEEEARMHPADDPEINDQCDRPEDDGSGGGDGAEESGGSNNRRGRKSNSGRSKGKGGGRGQFREPYEYGEILHELGINLSPQEIAIRYYIERARPYLIRFPVRRSPLSIEPLIEGVDTWDVGSPIDELDILESAMISPRLIPGVTTVRRVMGESPGPEPKKVPVDLDMYIDCSGSMPNPTQNTSFLTLAGAIIALSALRAGASVKATLWSGQNQYKETRGFTREERDILTILTDYFGGGTAFPIHRLRQTFETRTSVDRPVHVLVISDEGVDTMFSKDEQGNSGWDVAADALEKGRAGGTFVLNLYQSIEKYGFLKTAIERGWNVFRVKVWEDLVEFARSFARENYGETKK
ncbi:MAG: VWA domain-containing protein [Candidatus Ozemobacteraceae bacterium]